MHVYLIHVSGAGRVFRLKSFQGQISLVPNISHYASSFFDGQERRRFECVLVPTVRKIGGISISDLAYIDTVFQVHSHRRCEKKLTDFTSLYLPGQNYARPQGPCLYISLF